MPVSQEMFRIRKLLCHFYASFISVYTPNLNILSVQIINISSQLEKGKSIEQNAREIKDSIKYQTYMSIRAEVKFKQSLIILPEVVYDYTSTVVFH